MSQFLSTILEDRNGQETVELFFLDREGVKNIQRGGGLKFSAEGRKTLTPPKNSSTDMYPPLNCQQ